MILAFASCQETLSQIMREVRESVLKDMKHPGLDFGVRCLLLVFRVHTIGFRA